MKTNIFVVIFCFCITLLHAQSTYIDSINHLISAAKTDTARINLTNKKVYKLIEINLDASLNLARINLTDARKLNYKKGEAMALSNMATDLTMKGNYDSARNALTEAGKIIYSLGDSDMIAILYGGFGMLYGVQSKYDSSTVYYQKSVGIYERIGNKNSLSSSYGNLAIGYLMQSNFPQALLYQQKSLKLAEEQNNKTSQAYTLMNMGSTYLDMGDTVKSEQSFLKGIEIAKNLDIKNVELYGYSNIANLYFVMNNWEKSYSYAMRAEELAKAMGDASIQAASMVKAALALMKAKKYSEAEALTIKSMAIADSAKQPLTIYQAYSAMGAILVAQEKYREAIPLLEKSITTLKGADGYDESLAEAYHNLSMCYEKTGNYAKALLNYKVSSQIVDSVRGKENIRKATELSMTYEFDKKQSIANALQAKKNAETRSKQLLLLGGLLLAFIVAIGGWISYRNKQKANRQLRQQKEKVETTLTELKATQAQLIQSEKMASLGELTAGIAHEIQNPLNFVNNFSEVNTELIDELEQEVAKGNLDEVKEIARNIKENEEKINHHGKRVGDIVKGMLQHSRTNSRVKESTNINALADEYLRLSYHGLRAKDNSFNATMNTDFDKTAGNIKIIPQDIGRVLLNLYNNAFYAVTEKKKQQPEGLSAGQAGYEPLVSVSTKNINGKVEISVKDNGNGIPKNIVDKIFQPFFTTKPAGQGTGLGLSLSYDIVKAHGGEIKVESKEGEGTKFTVQLPA